MYALIRISSCPYLCLLLCLLVCTLSVSILRVVYGDVDMDLLAYNLPSMPTSRNDPPTMIPLPSGVVDDAAVNW